MSSERLDQYYFQADREARQEAQGQDPVSNRFDAKTFFSRSNGRGRRPRKSPRPVQLLTDRETGKSYTYDVGGGPVRGLDVIAQAMFGHTHDDPWDAFLARVASLFRRH